MTLAVLGTTWSTQIDVGALGGASRTFVLGYSAPLAGSPTAFGALLIDPGSPALLLSVQVLVSGGVSIHRIHVPSDPVLLGLPVFTQAFVRGEHGALTNAIDLVLGI